MRTSASTASRRVWRLGGKLVIAGTLSLLTFTAFGCAPAEPAPGPAQQAAVGENVFAFVNVNVVPMDRERVLAGQTVIVRNGRIAEIGPAAQVRVPAGAQRIEGEGRYLMPGLSEMHAHIPPPPVVQQYGEQYVDDVLFLYLSNGITVIRGMLGHADHLTLRERAARNEILSPRIYTSGPSINGNSAPTPEVVEQMVREQSEAGFDFLKIHPGLTRPVFDRMAATADQVGVRFAGHVPQEVGLQRALEARYASIDHLDGYMEALAEGRVPANTPSGFFGLNWAPYADEARISALARQAREAGVWNVPTQSLIEHLASPEDPEAMGRWPEMRYLPPQMVAQWVQAKRNLQGSDAFSPEAAHRTVELRHRLIRELHQAGAGLLLGSDAPQIFNVPGFSIQHELRMLVDAGLTPYQALETGTRNPAVYFGAQNEFGTVEVGRSADLILLEANPLQDIGNLQRRAGVIVRGRWLPESEIQQRLEAIAVRVGG